MSTKHYPPPLPGLPIFEPYAGSAGYSLNYADLPVVIWEDDFNLAILWQWMIEQATPDLVRQIPCGLPEGLDIRTLDLCQGQMLLLKHWQRTNNVGYCWTISKWGHLPGQWTTNTRARVADEMMAIKHWKLQPIDWQTPGTYFVDPPYLHNYRYRFPKTESFDYQGLVNRLSQVPAGSRIIVTEATCPKTGAVPDYLPFKPSHRQVTSRRKVGNNHHSNELIFTEDR